MLPNYPPDTEEHAEDIEFFQEPHGKGSYSTLWTPGKKKKKTHSITSRQHRPERFSPKIKSRFFGFLFFFFPPFSCQNGVGAGSRARLQHLGGNQSPDKGRSRSHTAAGPPQRQLEGVRTPVAAAGIELAGFCPYYAHKTPSLSPQISQI